MKQIFLTPDQTLDLLYFLDQLAAADDAKTCSHCDKDGYGEELHDLDCPFRTLYQLRNSLEEPEK